MKLKSLFLLVSPLLTLPATTSIAMEATDSHSPLQFSAHVVDADSDELLPQNLDAYAQKMPENMDAPIREFAKNNPAFMTALLGSDCRSYEYIVDDSRRAGNIIQQFGFVPFPSFSNFVFAMPEVVPAHLFKFVRPIIKFANAAQKADHQYDFNVNEQVRNPQQRTQGLIDLGKKLDALNQANPALALYETYQAFSAITGAFRVQRAKEQYDLDTITPVPTYPFVLDKSSTCNDRNCFIVQEIITGNPLQEMVSMELSSEKRALLKKALRQFCIVAVAAHLWNKDVFIRKDMTLSPVDLEKRDRYVNFKVTAAESKNLAGFMFELMGPVLQAHPEYLAVWDEMLRENIQVFEAAKAKGEGASKYFKALEASNS